MDFRLESLIRRVNNIVQACRFKIEPLKDYNEVRANCCSMFIGIAERAFETSIESIIRDPRDPHHYSRNANLLIHCLESNFKREVSKEVTIEKVISGDPSCVEALLDCFESILFDINSFEASQCINGSRNERNSVATSDSNLSRKAIYNERLNRAKSVIQERATGNLLKSQDLKRENLLYNIQASLENAKKKNVTSRKIARRKRELEDIENSNKENTRKLQAEEKFMTDQIELWTEKLKVENLKPRKINQLLKKINELKMNLK